MHYAMHSLISVMFVICPMLCVSQGKPVFYRVEDCQYTFEWRTSVVCNPSELVMPSAGCLFTYKEMNLTFDLSPLQNKSFQVCATMYVI